MRYYIILLLIFFINPNIFGSQFIVHDIPTIQKLPVGNINIIFHDSEGFIWYGTDRGGLCRDDGFNIKTFRSDFNNPDLISNNWITAISEDSQKKIWFGTRRGLYILDKKDYSIKPVKNDILNRHRIYSIDILNDSSIWVSSEYDIFHYNIKGEIIRFFPLEINDQRRPVSKIYNDDNDDIWMMRWREGLFKLDKKENIFVKEDINSFKKAWPVDVIKDPVAPYYWFATWGNGIVRLNTEEKDPSKKFTEFSCTKGDRNCSKNKVGKIAYDYKNRYIWSITEDNIYCYEIQDNGELCNLNIPELNSSEKKDLNDIKLDRYGNIWVAGQYPGSVIISEYEDRFTKDKMDIVKTKTGFTAAPYCFVYENNYFWIWQKNLGLYLYYPETGEMKTFSDGKRKISPLMIKVNNDVGIYTVASNYTIIHLKLKDEEVVSTEIATLPLHSKESVRCIYEDHNNDLWIGTSENLYHLDIKSDKLDKVWEKTGIINDIVSNKNGDIFVTTETKGLLCYYADGNKRSIASNERLQNLIIDSEERLWFNTEQGNLYFTDYKKENFISYTKEAQLSGEPIMDLETDIFGNICILTDRNAIKLNYKDHSYISINSYSKVASMLNFLKFGKDDSGSMYIGGTGGMCKYTPSNSETIQLAGIASVYITSVKVNGEERLICDENLNIELNHNERNIEIFISTLDPINRNNTQFAFRTNKNCNFWNYIPKGQNSILLMGLNSGNHVIELKARNKDGYWSHDITKIRIYRAPEWYATWLAFASYFIILTSLIIYAMRQYLLRQKNKHRFEMEEQVTKMKYMFYTNVSHELRTPLSLIITPLESIIRKTESPDLQLQLRALKKNADNMLKLVNQLLDFRKIEVKGEELFCSKGDMNLFLLSLYEDFLYSAQEKQIDFNYTCDAAHCIINADFDKVHKIVNNLLSNALKFTPENGKIELSLRYEKVENGNFAVIRVKDNGKGISEKDIPFIFERYKQIRTGKIITGTGIGLHIVKEYTSMHKGTIKVESEEGNGTLFDIFLPVDSVSAEEEKLNKRHNDIITKAKDVDAVYDDKKKKLLLVEDNHEFREYLKTELSLSYLILEAENGDEGFRLALEKEPDLIISDLMMPVIDGFGLCNMIKNNIRTSHIPFILLTASFDVDNMKRGYKEGADSYLTKPFNNDILLSRIENLLQRRLYRQKCFQNNLEIEPANITISSLDEKLIEKAIKIIENNISDPDFSVEILSSEMAMSRMNLYRKINSITGTSPSEFIRSIRLKKAAHLLSQGNLNSTEVAYSVGFNSPAYFARQFKELFGISPKEYKAKIITLK